MHPVGPSSRKRRRVFLMAESSSQHDPALSIRLFIRYAHRWAQLVTRWTRSFSRRSTASSPRGGREPLRCGSHRRCASSSSGGGGPRSGARSLPSTRPARDRGGGAGGPTPRPGDDRRGTLVTLPGRGRSGGRRPRSKRRPVRVGDPIEAVPVLSWIVVAPVTRSRARSRPTFRSARTRTRRHPARPRSTASSRSGRSFLTERVGTLDLARGSALPGAALAGRCC